MIYKRTQKSILKPVLELFFNIPFDTKDELASPIHSTELLNLLRLLEDATREMEFI